MVWLLGSGRTPGGVVIPIPATTPPKHTGCDVTELIPDIAHIARTNNKPIRLRRISAFLSSASWQLNCFAAEVLYEPVLCDSVIHNTIITDKAEWTEYMEEVRRHRDDQDPLNARTFARAVLEKL